MENLRLGVSAVRHDMKREETIEEAEKNTKLGRQTPKGEAGGSIPFWRAKKQRIQADFCLYPLLFIPNTQGDFTSRGRPFAPFVSTASPEGLSSASPSFYSTAKRPPS